MYPEQNEEQAIKDMTHGPTSVVEKFEEKPNIKKAQYFYENQFLWNAGIFMATREVILNSIKKFAPEIAKTCDDVYKNQIQKPNSNDISFKKSLFKKIPAISIDYAIMKKLIILYATH